MNIELFYSLFRIARCPAWHKAPGGPFFAPARKPALPDACRCRLVVVTLGAPRPALVPRPKAAPMSQSDPPDFDWIQRALYTAVVADVLDALGRRGQVLSGEWRRASGSGLLVGRAKTTLWEERDAPDPRPYELELQSG